MPLATPTNPTSRASRGFTLVELLVCLAVVTILMALLLPALDRAREMSRRTVCMANLRQIGIASEAYANDFKDYYPRTDPFADNQYMLVNETEHDALISSYLSGNRLVLWCPNWPMWAGTKYPKDSCYFPGSNAWYIGYFLYYRPGNGFGPGKRTSVTAAPNTVRTGHDFVWTVPFARFAAHFRGSVQEGVNQSAADGSVRWRAYDDLAPMMTASIPFTLIDIKMW